MMIRGSNSPSIIFFMRKNKNLFIGKTFNSLTVLSEENTNKHFKRRMKCICECGKTKVVLLSSLKNEHTKSCGCRRSKSFRKVITKHGLSNSRIYVLWRGMIARCEYPKHITFEHYGGRGISVCPEWKDFERFFKWSIENNYSDSLSIDRIDSNGNYEPNNCRWIKKAQQSENKRSSITVHTNDGEISLKEYCILNNISYTCGYKRLKKGVLNAS